MNATQNAQQLTRPAGATPVQIDTLLAALDYAYPTLQHAVDTSLYYVHLAAGDKKVRQGKREVWQMSNPQAIAALEDTDPVMIGLVAAEQEARANRAEFDRLDAEYDRRGGWTRFVQVEHIHSGWNCAGGTLDRGEFRSERHWRPEFSGKNEADAIAVLQGRAETLCTHCFPNAPVAPRAVNPDHCPGSGQSVDREAGAHNLRGHYGKWATCPHCHQRITVSALYIYRTHDTTDAAARKLAEKAKAAGKIVVDGELKTVRAVELMAGEGAYEALVFVQNATEAAQYTTQRDKAVALLAQHTGRPAQEILAKVETKAAAKYKRDYQW